MGEILSGLKGIMCLLDDVLVYGETPQEHDERLRVALKRISKAGLTLSREKCEFNKPSIKFLGQLVDGTGVKLDPDKLCTIVASNHLRISPNSVDSWE